jgi:hypothetical protein
MTRAALLALILALLQVTRMALATRMCKLQTMEKQVPLPKEMPIQERLALNVQFFSDLEDKIKEQIIKY